MDEETEAQRIQVAAPGGWPRVPMSPCAALSEAGRTLMGAARPPESILGSLPCRPNWSPRQKGNPDTAFVLRGMLGFCSW